MGHVDFFAVRAERKIVTAALVTISMIMLGSVSSDGAPRKEVLIFAAFVMTTRARSLTSS
jgi:hypothetical protein